MLNRIKSYFIDTVAELRSFYDELGSTSNKLRIIVKYKKSIFAILFVVAFFLGFIGYLVSDDSTGLEVLNNTIGLFIFAWAGDDSVILDFAKIFALAAMSFGAMTLYLSQSADQYEIERIQDSPYTLLIGLGEQNSAFLDQIDEGSQSTLVIESDMNNPRIELYKQKGFGVILSKAEDAIDTLNLAGLDTCIISTGNDRRNIAIGLLLMRKLNDRHQRVYVRIENRDLNVLFKQKIIESQNNVDIITYSLYENMTKALFAKHSVLGIQPDIAQSDKTFSTVVVGSSDLAEEIVYQLVMLSILPNQNSFTLHLVAPDATQFYARLQKLFTGITQIPHLHIKTHDLEYDDIAFYQHKVWNSRNLTNVIISTNDDEQNLDIAINLQDTTYLEKSTKGTLQTKVLFGLHHNLGLGKVIDENKEAFANFYSFASMTEASSPESLIDEKLDTIAKWSNFYYAKMYGGEDIETEWTSASMHDKLSTKAQVLHMTTKLTTLGLSFEKSNQGYDALYSHNKVLFDKALDLSSYGDEPIETFTVDRFPKSFDSAIDKLARSEHNRWNAFHYLYGWKHATKRAKELKQHHCLLPLEEFDRDELKDTYRHDLASIVNIPLYLAQAGYELVEAEDV